MKSTEPSDLAAFLLDLHARLLRGDGRALDEIPVLQHRLERGLRVRFHGYHDQDAVHDAAEHAVLLYLASPKRFDPARARLDTFLGVIAGRRLLHYFRTDARRQRREQTAAADTVDLASPSNQPPDVAVLFALIDEVAQGPEREFLLAKAHGERRTEPLARILGLDARPADQLKQEVKRTSDRLMMRLRRLAHAKGQRSDRRASDPIGPPRRM